MTSHRRPGLLARLCSGRASRPATPAPRVGIELVDGRTRVAHRVTTEELMAASSAGSCIALCGMRVFVASPHFRLVFEGLIHASPSRGSKDTTTQVQKACQTRDWLTAALAYS